MLKENIVTPGPIFVVFSLPPCWLCFLIGISGLALQTVPFIKELLVLSSPSLAGPVFSFVTGSVKYVHKCVTFSYVAEVLWNNMLVLLFAQRKNSRARFFSLILLMITLTCRTFLFTTLVFLKSKCYAGQPNELAHNVKLLFFEKNSRSHRINDQTGSEKADPCFYFQ